MSMPTILWLHAKGDTARTAALSADHAPTAIIGSTYDRAREDHSSSKFG
jgi:hypothetical protein